MAHDSLDKADFFASHFAASSTIDNSYDKTPLNYPTSSVEMPTFSTRKVRHALQRLKINKSPGPDKIPAIILKHCAAELAPIL